MAANYWHHRNALIMVMETHLNWFLHLLCQPYHQTINQSIFPAYTLRVQTINKTENSNINPKSTRKKYGCWRLSTMHDASSPERSSILFISFLKRTYIEIMLRNVHSFIIVCRKPKRWTRICARKCSCVSWNHAHTAHWPFGIN